MKRQFREPSEETRTKMSVKKAGDNNPMFGKSRDEKTKQKISQALTKYWKTIPSMNNDINSNEL